MNELREFAKRTRGGQQAAAQFEANYFASRNHASELSKLLLDRWRWGHIPATFVQEVAQAAVHDLDKAYNLKINAWLTLAQLGSAGEHTNNVHRDLLRKLPKERFALCQHTVPLQIATTKGVPSRTVPVRLPMIMPETIWFSLWKSKHFQKYILEDARTLPSFWSACGQHPALLNHPVKTIQNYAKRAVPVVLHGDGAAVTMHIGSNSKSCLFLSFRSLVATASIHFLMAAVWTMACSKGRFNTSKAIFRRIARSFEALMDCQTTGGFFPVVIWTTGDLEYFSDFHHVARWNASRPCCLCSVPKEALQHVPQFETLALQADDWSLPRSHPCPLFESLMSPQSIAPDYMHTKHLGCDLRLLGSVVWMMIFELPSTESLEHRLQTLLHEAKVPWLQARNWLQQCWFLFLSFASFLCLRLSGLQRKVAAA
jgi:hypothetical protein